MTHTYACNLRVLLTGVLLVLGGLLPFTVQADTLQRIKASNTFILGFVPAYAPFSDGDTQNAKGYTIDLCLQVAEHLRQQLALPQLQIRYQPVAIDDMLKAVSDGRVDILCSPVDETLKRRAQVSFSLPIMVSGLGVAVRRDAPAALLDPLKGERSNQGPLWRGNVARQLDSFRFAVLAGTHNAEWVQARLRALGLKSSLVEVTDIRTGLQQVAEAKVDAFFDERLVLLSYLAEEWHGDQLQVLDRLFQETPAALPVARADEDFRLQVDSALSTLLQSPAGDSLYRLYFGDPSVATRQMFQLYPRP